MFYVHAHVISTFSIQNDHVLVACNEVSCVARFVHYTRYTLCGVEVYESPNLRYHSYKYTGLKLTHVLPSTKTNFVVADGSTCFSFRTIYDNGMNFTKTLWINTRVVPKVMSNNFL